MSQAPNPAQIHQATTFLEESGHGDIVVDAWGFPWQKTKGVLDGEVVELWVRPGRVDLLLSKSLAARFAPFTLLGNAKAPTPTRGSTVA